MSMNKDMSLYCSTALNSSAVVFIKAEFPPHSAIYNFNQQKWVKFPELQNYAHVSFVAMKCYTTSSFNKNGKQNLMVLNALIDETTYDYQKPSKIAFNGKGTQNILVSNLNFNFVTEILP